MAVTGNPRAESLASRHRLTLAAVRQLEGNASAQLAMEGMLSRMRAV